MIKIFSLFVCLLLHPVHVSLTSIDHVQDTDSLKVLVRMYYDDLISDCSLFFSSGDFDGNAYQQVLLPEEYMKKYLDDRIRIRVNNKQLKGKLLNMVLAEDEVTANLLFITEAKPETITVSNLIMAGLYTDQANMTIVHVSDLEEGVKFTPEYTEKTFILK
ncbi:MAG: hypothetical protein GXY51_12250 [Bacteroidetes bacterium]|jgi:hypothetical protein|nr:hypothetical protein [Bacteroidota bacterium]